MNLNIENDNWYRVSLLGHRVYICRVRTEVVHGAIMWRLYQNGSQPDPHLLINPATAVFSVEGWQDPRPLRDLRDGWSAVLAPGYRFNYTVTDPLGVVTSFNGTEDEVRQHVGLQDTKQNLEIQHVNAWNECIIAAHKLRGFNPAKQMRLEQAGEVYATAIGLANKLSIPIQQTREEFIQRGMERADIKPSDSNPVRRPAAENSMKGPFALAGEPLAVNVDGSIDAEFSDDHTMTEAEKLMRLTNALRDGPDAATLLEATLELERLSRRVERLDAAASAANEQVIRGIQVVDEVLREREILIAVEKKLRAARDVFATAAEGLGMVIDDKIPF